MEMAKSCIPRSNLNFVEANQINVYFTIFFDMNPDIIGGKVPDDNLYLN